MNDTQLATFLTDDTPLPKTALPLGERRRRDAIDEAQVERDLSRKIVDETRRMTLETLRASRSAIESSRS